MKPQVLVVGVSSRALFDMEEANRVFETEGVEAYARYQMQHQDAILAPGAGFPLIRSLLNLNKKAGTKKAEVVIMSRNDPTTSLRMFESIKHYGLDIGRAALAGGASLAPYLRAFEVNLFLSGLESDVVESLQSGFAAGLILGSPTNPLESIDPIRIAFDADAVLFSDEAERVYREQGLEAFLRTESENACKPLPDGPFAPLLRTLSSLQSDAAFAERPVRLAVVTARNLPAHERVIRTLLAWDVHVDEAFFMGGSPKTRVLEAFRPHIYFDDQDEHLQAAKSVVPTAKVFPRDSK